MASDKYLLTSIFFGAFFLVFGARPIFSLRFDEVKSILISHGFENVRTRGSNFIFTDNRNVISIPVHNNTVKKIYLEKIIEILKLEG